MEFQRNVGVEVLSGCELPERQVFLREMFESGQMNRAEDLKPYGLTEFLRPYFLDSDYFLKQIACGTDSQVAFCCRETEPESGSLVKVYRPRPIFGPVGNYSVKKLLDVYAGFTEKVREMLPQINATLAHKIFVGDEEYNLEYEVVPVGERRERNGLTAIFYPDWVRGDNLTCRNNDIFVCTEVNGLREAINLSAWNVLIGAHFRVILQELFNSFSKLVKELTKNAGVDLSGTKYKDAN